MGDERLDACGQNAADQQIFAHLEHFVCGMHEHGGQLAAPMRGGMGFASRVRTGGQGML
ncbi:hypothetical protein D3C74_410360 [compost metagenome]